MADANTTLYGFVKPEVGASADTWGSKWNQNNDDYDGLLGAYTLTGSSNAYVLTTGMSLAAYASGQRFCVKWNHTNSGTATLNVDTLGAKTIKKRDASTNCSASDLVSGTYAVVTYDGTNFVLLSHVASDVQPLDATLTALAALSWSSGNALVQFTAADTVSLTLAPSVSSVTASQGVGNTTPTAVFINTTDATPVRVARFEGDRATPGALDAMYNSFFMSNASGTQVEFARDTTIAITATAGAEDGFKRMALMKAGVLTNTFEFYHGYFAPSANDLVPLGSAALSWSDLFLASGAVINFNNGNLTITHSAGLLAISGATQARMPRSSESSGTLTSASANKMVITSAGVTINDGVFTADDVIVVYNDSASSVTITQDTGMTLRFAGTTSTGNRTLAPRGMCTIYVLSSTEAIISGNIT